MSDDAPSGSRPPVPIPGDDAELLAQCRIETFRSGGPGGQHQNVTESGVRLVHLPTGIRVSSREDRSQHRNKEIALARLRTKLAALNRRAKPRKKTRVPRGEKARRRESKRKRGETKRLRKRPGPED